MQWVARREEGRARVYPRVFGGVPVPAPVAALLTDTNDVPGPGWAQSHVAVIVASARGRGKVNVGVRHDDDRHSLRRRVGTSDTRVERDPRATRGRQGRQR